MVAITRTLPALICGSAVVMLSNMNGSVPPMESVSAAALPLYGICVKRTPAMVASSSADNWLVEPLPAEPKSIEPGLARAARSRSSSVL